LIYEDRVSNADIVDYKLTYSLPATTLNIGQYYKVQLAYLDTDGEVGYYSTVGIMKGIAKPEITIGLDAHSVNFFQGSFTGYYTIPEQIGGVAVNDLSERVYSY